MKPQFIQINGLNLAYYTQNDDRRKILFFVHGNSLSACTWRKQFDDSIFDSYRLIAIDLPGHGQSDSSVTPNEDYTLPGLARLAAEALGQLVGEYPCILAGMSMGANLVAEMLPYGITPQGIVLAGPSVVGEGCPVSAVVQPGTHVYTVFTEEAPREEVVIYGQESSLRADSRDLELFVEGYFRVDPAFRRVLSRSLDAHQYGDEIRMLRNSGIPQCVIMGAEERVVYPNYLDNVSLPLWRDTVHLLPGASHLVQVDQPAAFNELVKAFASEVFSE